MLLAEEQLNALEVVIYPVLKEDRDRRRIMEKYMMLIDSEYQEKQVKNSKATLERLKSKFGYKGKR
jgi:hypothetical protein